MTEYEINKAVAEKLEIMQYMFDGKDSESIIWDVPSNNLYNGFVSSRGNLFDPCNDAKDAWKIMLANNISIVELIGSYEAYHNLIVNSFDDCEYDLVSMHKKPFVAAMLLFLEI